MFYERQRLPRALDLAAMLGSMVGAAFCVWVGETRTDEPPWAGLAVASAVLLVLGFGMEMRVRIRAGAVVLMLTPVYRKVLPTWAITEAQASLLPTFRDSGDRGLRCRQAHAPGRMALMLSARSCVELKTVHGRTYVVGTARPAELLGALGEMGVPVHTAAADPT
jgi:hypothetical protein